MKKLISLTLSLVFLMAIPAAAVSAEQTNADVESLSALSDWDILLEAGAGENTLSVASVDSEGKETYQCTFSDGTVDSISVQDKINTIA